MNRSQRWLQALLVAGIVVLSTPVMAQSLEKPKAAQVKGIENFFQVTEKVYSGGSPVDEAAFAELQKRGIKTLISVDGSKPDVELAKKYGMRYVHLPMGYDGVSTNQAVKLVKAAESYPQPVFVHCHHGMHRGPAAVGAICMGIEKWTPERAVAWMKDAGTASNYAGLYKTVAEFRPPSAAELKKMPGMFPEKVEVSPMVDGMVEIDNRFDNLKLVKKAGYKQPSTHPDISPAHETLLLQELLRELGRSAETKSKYKPDFITKMAASEAAAKELHSVLSKTPVDTMKAEAAFQKITESCSSCHKAYRN